MKYFAPNFWIKVLSESEKLHWLAINYTDIWKKNRAVFFATFTSSKENLQISSVDSIHLNTFLNKATNCYQEYFFCPWEEMY